MTSSLFAKVSQEHVQEVLDNLHKFTGLQISLINDQGELVLSFGSNPRYCKLLKKNIFPKEHCFAVQLKAGQYAQKIGEPYIFSCHGNQNAAESVINSNMPITNIFCQSDRVN